MPVTLYQELIDLIIDEVADFDHKTSLFNCSLTSWSFHSSARKHIFRQIFISHRGQAPFREKSQTRLENLINILESDPSRSHPEFSPLSSDVRSLELFLIPPSESFTTIAMADKIRSCWDDFLSSLPILLQHLSGVQEFTLGTVSSINSWPALGNAVQSTLLQFFASPSLTSLEFLSVTQLPIMSIMSCCQNLHDLSLYSSTMAEAEIIPTSLSTGIGSLESLSLDTSSGLPFGLSYFYNVPYTPGKDPSMLWLSLKSLTIASIPPDLFSLGKRGTAMHL
jgi:hypothetical protein